MLRCALFTGLFWVLAGSAAFAEEVRYFAVWSYMENAPADEITDEDRPSRKLGYWKLLFGEDGQVLGGTYYGADGAIWLSIRYVRAEGRIYADLFGPDGTVRGRKSTNLSSLRPRWPEPR